MASAQTNIYLSHRPALLGLVQTIVTLLLRLPFSHAAPFRSPSRLFITDEPEGKAPGDPALWVYLGVAAALVLLGGAFAGLTIALMGQVCILPAMLRWPEADNTVRTKSTSR